jgi:hypothetical protein
VLTVGSEKEPVCSKLILYMVYSVGPNYPVENYWYGAIEYHVKWWFLPT